MKTQNALAGCAIMLGVVVIGVALAAGMLMVGAADGAGRQPSIDHGQWQFRVADAVIVGLFLALLGLAARIHCELVEMNEALAKSLLGNRNTETADAARLLKPRH